MAQLGLKDYLILAAGILLIALSLSFAQVKEVGGDGSAPVTVVNTPLPVQGTVNDIVTGNVGITGTQNVTLFNTPSSPVPTRNVGGGAATHVGQLGVDSLISFMLPILSPNAARNFPTV
jgi:hypothetical protein